MKKLHSFFNLQELQKWLSSTSPIHRSGKIGLFFLKKAMAFCVFIYGVEVKTVNVDVWNP